MNRKVKKLSVYVLSYFVRDIQGLNSADEVYKNYKDPENEAYEDFEILWEECRKVDITGDVVTCKEVDLTPEEAVKTLNREVGSLNAVCTLVDITFCNGKEFVGIDIETAKKELEREENYYPSDVVTEIKNKLETLRCEMWQLNDSADCQDEYNNSFDEIIKLLEG